MDYSLAESTPIGIQEVVTSFERSFRANHRDAVRDTPTLPPDRVRHAIRSGVFVGGGRTYDCENEAAEATSVLLNRIANTYQHVAGGALPWDSIILTGGGSAMLYDRLLPLLGHDHVILADEAESIHLGQRTRRTEAVAAVRSTGALMSEVISFRLDPKNPREAEALQVLTRCQEQGYCVRHILTEALLRFENAEAPQEVYTQISGLLAAVDWMSDQLQRLPHAGIQAIDRPDLRTSTLAKAFVLSVKSAAGPGLQLEG